MKSTTHRNSGPLNARLHAGLTRNAKQRRSGDATSATTLAVAPATLHSW
ncbi:hypothetical protein ACS5PN_30165 [Roseateles sp. NT4]